MKLASSSRRPRHARCAASVLAVCVSAIACGTRAESESGRPLRIATGDPAGPYGVLGQALVQIAEGSLRGATASAASTGGLNANMDAVETGSADFALATADVAYLAFTQGTPTVPRPHQHLRAIAVLYPNVLQIVVRRTSAIRRIEDLNGMRVAMAVVANPSPADAANRVRLVDLVAHAYRLSPSDLHVVRKTFNELTESLRSGRVDSGFVMAGYPVTTITDLAKEEGIRLLDVDGVAATRMMTGAPFYKRVAIPEGTYPGQTQRIWTIGVDNVLVCRDDLSEDLVHRMTDAFFDALPTHPELHGLAKQIHPNLAAATTIPLHSGAAQYYREYELLR